MALRIAVGGFMHESATFVDTPTTWDDFARTGAGPAPARARPCSRPWRD